MEFLISLLETTNPNIDVEQVERIFILLLILPLVSTIAGIFRYIVGLRSLSIYAPIALTFAFYELGYVAESNDLVKTDFFRGLVLGIVLYVIIFFSTAIAYKFLKPLRMHYTPKTALVLTVVSIVLIAFIFATTYIFKRQVLLNESIIFSIIIIATLSDNFVSLLSRKSLGYTGQIAFETLIIAVLSFGIIAWNDARVFIGEYPWALLIFLVIINTYVGKFVGLRIKEYWRFSDLLLSKPKENASETAGNKKK